MALLVGSDYTVGLNGIGPVTALEILASFPSTQQSLLEGLEKFRDWFTGRNKTASPRHSLKRKIRNTVISSGMFFFNYSGSGVIHVADCGRSI